MPEVIVSRNARHNICRNICHNICHISPSIFGDKGQRDRSLSRLVQNSFWNIWNDIPERMALRYWYYTIRDTDLSPVSRDLSPVLWQIQNESTYQSPLTLMLIIYNQQKIFTNSIRFYIKMPYLCNQKHNILFT